MTHVESVHYAVEAIIEADLTAHETRTALWSLIPKEHHVKHNH